MSEILEAVDVEVPVRIAYDQWTQFEEFPRFMEGVKSVRQIDDTHLEWHAEIAGVEKRWTAEITEQTPDQRIAWNATEGAKNAGVVTFHRLDDSRSRVTLQLDVEPEGPVETAGDALGHRPPARGDRDGAGQLACPPGLGHQVGVSLEQVGHLQQQVAALPRRRARPLALVERAVRGLDRSGGVLGPGLVDLGHERPVGGTGDRAATTGARSDPRAVDVEVRHPVIPSAVLRSPQRSADPATIPTAHPVPSAAPRQ